MLIIDTMLSPIYWSNIVPNHSTQHELGYGFLQHELETNSHLYFVAYVFKLWGYQTSTFVGEVASEFTSRSKTNETLTFKSSS